MKFEWGKKKHPVVLGAIITAIATVLAALILVSPNIFQSTGESALQLVDVSFIESGEFPKLDIKLRNTGEKVAFLKQVNFKVKKIWQLTPAVPPPYSAKVSWNYNIMLPISGAPYSVSESISQSIKPNAVDRFTFTLGNDGSPGVHEYVFFMTTELIYDEDNKTLTSQNLLFSARGASQHKSFISPQYMVKLDPLPDMVIQNRRALDEIDKINGLKSNRIKELLRSLSEVPVEEAPRKKDSQ